MVEPRNVMKPSAGARMTEGWDAAYCHLRAATGIPQPRQLTMTSDSPLSILFALQTAELLPTPRPHTTNYLHALTTCWHVSMQKHWLHLWPHWTM